MKDSFISRATKDYTLRRLCGVTADAPDKYFYVLTLANVFEMVEARGLNNYAASQIGIVLLEGQGQPTDETDEQARAILKANYLK